MIIRWINPTDLGIWQSISIFQVYLPFAELGITNGLNRELPYNFGAGKKLRAHQFAMTAQSYAVFLSIVSMILTVGVIVICIIFSFFSDKVILAIATVGTIISVNFYYRYLTVTYRSSQAFRSLARIQIIKSVLMVLVVPVVYFFQYTGLLIFQTLNFLIPAILMYRERPLLVGLHFRKYYFKHLVKIGLPAFGLNYVRGWLNTIPRLILLTFSTVTMVGLYTPVMAIKGLNILPSVLANYFFPRMSQQLGESNDPSELRPLITKLNFGLFFVGVILSVLVWFLIPFAMEFLFPEYREATKAVQIASLGFMFVGRNVSHNLLLAMVAYSKSSRFLALEVLLLVACPLLMLLSNFSILESVAAGVVIAEGILFVANYFLLITSTREIPLAQQ
jgi:O-antigen/teichoic acid export membrane protein